MSDLICNDPSVKEARKHYEARGTKQALYNYQKTVLETLESAETALAAFNYEREKAHYLENAKNLTNETYQLTKDLNNQGFKDHRDLLLVYQKLLLEEDLLIQGKVELLISYINLYHALSSAWEACCNCS
jgi:outer membrane protein TolC